MSNIITRHSDPVEWNNPGDYIYMTVRNMDVGFYKPYGVFALRPGGVRALLNEPAVYIMPRIRFKPQGQSWDFLNTNWVTTVANYAGEEGEAWNTVTTFGWNREFEVRDPPAGPDCRIKNYIVLGRNHQSYRFRTKITSYVALENIGIEYMFFVNQTYVSALTDIYVEKQDHSSITLPIAQAKDIKTDIPDAVAKIGLYYNITGAPPRLLFIFDAQRWDYEIIQTAQRNIGGTDYWVLSVGGADLITPRAVAADEEVIL